MIKGNKKLTIQAILAKITPYDIYRYYTPRQFKINKAFKSPLRSDKYPSFVIYIDEASGNTYHMDFVVGEDRGDCFQYVQQLFHITLSEAMLKIDHDFGLGLAGKGNEAYKVITAQYEQPIKKLKPSVINIVPREFTQEELAYWNMFHIDISELKREDIFAPAKVFLNGSRMPNYKNQLRFAYRIESEGKEYWKVYSPNETDKRLKWVPNNIPNDLTEGLADIPNSCKNVIVSKSRKDRIIIKKFFPEVCSAQNEGATTISDRTIAYLRDRAEEGIYISFDSDETGKKNSMFYTENFGMKHINTPDRYLAEGIKDWADLAKAYGVEACIQQFKEKGLL